MGNSEALNIKGNKGESLKKICHILKKMNWKK